MKPAFRIEVNGSDITQLVADRLFSLAVTDEAGVNSDRVEMVIDDRDQRLSIPPTKATMQVWIGYEDQLIDRGTYTVEEVELQGNPRMMTIRGNAIGASKGSGAARETSWHDTTLGTIARSIASRHKWQASVSADLDSIKIDHADQHENDLQFLSRLAAESGAVVKVASGRLILAPHGQAKRVSGKDMPAVTIVANDTTDWRMTLAERGNYTGVKAMYHDLATGKRGEAVAGGDDVNTHSLPHTYSTKAAATRAAKTRLATLKRGKSKLSINDMPGIPTLAAETKATLKDFRKGVDGDWIVVRVVHSLSDSGYTSSLECETPDGKDTGN